MDDRYYMCGWRTRATTIEFTGVLEATAACDRQFRIHPSADCSAEEP